MLQLRFALSILLMFAQGLASVEMSVSGTEAKFILENESPLSLHGSLQSGDLFLENIDLDANSPAPAAAAPAGFAEVIGVFGRTKNGVEGLRTGSEFRCVGFANQDSPGFPYALHEQSVLFRNVV